MKLLHFGDVRTLADALHFYSHASRFVSSQSIAEAATDDGITIGIKQARHARSRAFVHTARSRTRPIHHEQLGAKDDRQPPPEREALEERP